MANRLPLIAGNWKLHKTVEESIKTAEAINALNKKNADEVEVMIAPVYTALYSVGTRIKGSSLKLGSQNIYWEEQGAFTGEISPGMLKDCNCDYAIIGHSERRQFFGETDSTVNKRIKAASKFGIKPVFCIGETESERDTGKTFNVLDKQVKDGLKDLTSGMLKDLVIAYEPVWAIGTGKTATTEQVDEVHTYLRSLLEKMFDSTLANNVRILYGGSVKPANINELMALKDVDGALVGGASLEAETFSKIINY
jgi:triosephosphate isomerase